MYKLNFNLSFKLCHFPDCRSANQFYFVYFQVLQDLLIRYIRQIGVDLRAKAELCNRTEPNLYDLQRVFDDHKVRLSQVRLG